MATRFANVMGVQAERASQNPQGAVLATVTYDLASQVYTGGADTVQLGGGGFDNRTPTTSTLAALIQSHRRNGKTVALISAMPATDPGRQAAATTNGPALYPQAVAVSGANVTLNLFNAYTAGAAVTCAASPWDAVGQIEVLFTET
jgi:N-acetylglucosamine-6-phosphate deacetylase